METHWWCDSLTLSVVLFRFRGLNVVVVSVLVCLLGMASWHFANSFKPEKRHTCTHGATHVYLTLWTKFFYALYINFHSFIHVLSDLPHCMLEMSCLFPVSCWRCLVSSPSLVGDVLSLPRLLLEMSCRLFPVSCWRCLVSSPSLVGDVLSSLPCLLLEMSFPRLLLEMSCLFPVSCWRCLISSPSLVGDVSSLPHLLLEMSRLFPVSCWRCLFLPHPHLLEKTQVLWRPWRVYQCFNFWNDLLGWERIQARPKQTGQEHQDGRWGGGEKTRKPHRRSSSSISDRRTKWRHFWQCRVWHCWTAGRWQLVCGTGLLPSGTDVWHTFEIFLFYFLF